MPDFCGKTMLELLPAEVVVIMYTVHVHIHVHIMEVRLLLYQDTSSNRYTPFQTAESLHTYRHTHTQKMLNTLNGKRKKKQTN